MAHLQKFNTPTEFLDYNISSLTNQYFEHFHLLRLFEDLEQGTGALYDAYNLLDDDGSNVMIILANELCFIYGTKWNADILTIIEEEVNFAIENIRVFRGQKELVFAILDKMNIKHKMINDRVIYACAKLSPCLSDAQIEFSAASLIDAPELFEMSTEYYDEEFEGKGSFTSEEVKTHTLGSIQREKLFKIAYDGQIVAMARIINDDHKNVIIGGLFTRRTERGKGYGYLMIWRLTEHLLGQGKRCGLLTELTKTSTNKIFEKVFYKNVYNWINVVKLD